MIPALFSTFAIAVGLAMDAFSVSLAGGAALKKDIVKTAVLTGLMFGFFQFAMPVIGWLVGAPISSIINPYGYWIVVALFFFIGGKMIYDAVKGEEEGVS
ncbi:MAG TPA: manganese efflux pump, partial [Methanocorpusculum sp.]|nr:manganese efflux pump [Methanocorpusculum sp.]